MSFVSKVRDAVVTAGRWLAEAPEPSNNPGPTLPRRQREAAVTVERALSLSTFYRGIQIHATAACQISIDVERNGEIVVGGHPLVNEPSRGTSRSTFIEHTVVSLYTDGNAFWRITRDSFGRAIDLTGLNPNEVTVHVEYAKNGDTTTTYGWRGLTLKPADIRHLQLLRIPGLHRGLGPIQAATIEIRGALDARDYGAMWLSDSKIPDGVLSSDQELAPGDSTKIKHVWYGRKPDGTPDESMGEFDDVTERVRVLGKGMSYSPIALKPSDVQFLETQQFTNIQMARLIGAPASIMLVAVEGNSNTYTNVEQEWIGYVRFSLMKPLREIEEALSSLLPGHQKARFNVNALLRTDTKTRYEAHAMSLDPQKGWMTRDEVRAHESLPALTEAQRTEFAERTATPAPTQEPANA